VNGAAAGAAWAKAGAAAASATNPASADIFEIRLSINLPPSNSIIVLFAGTDPHRLFDVDDEDLAVADRSGLRGMLDRLDYAVGVISGDHHLDSDLRDQVRLVFGAAIDFG